jgi:hypothetical protein
MSCRAPSPLPAGIVVDADYAKDCDEEHIAFEMMLRKSGLAREAERRRAIALVEARVVKLEPAELIELSEY